MIEMIELNNLWALLVSPSKSNGFVNNNIVVIVLIAVDEQGISTKRIGHAP